MPDVNPMAMMGGAPTGNSPDPAGPAPAGQGALDPTMLLRNLARHGKKRRKGGGRYKAKRKR